MSNPPRILKTVGQRLTLPTEIALFGRSGLGVFANPVPEIQELFNRARPRVLALVY